MDKHSLGTIAYYSGHAAERQAQIYLEYKGYQTIATNLKAPQGSGANEVDLIMLDKSTLVFIEVKKRNSLTSALEAITPRLQKRLYRAAEVFLSKHPEYVHLNCRFDVLLINKENHIQHLENVIQ